jgi:hypothetical protein
MIIRVDWNGNSENVTVYQAGCYSVLKGPGTAYIMNDQGKTIDVLRP